MSLDNADFWQLISCVYTILHLAEGAGRLSEAPALIDELCAMVELSEDRREAVEKLVRTAVGY